MKADCRNSFSFLGSLPAQAGYLSEWSIRRVSLSVKGIDLAGRVSIGIIPIIVLISLLLVGS
jgi:hypothetical protein